MARDEVEDFIDRVNSIDNLIDIYSPFIQRRRRSEDASDRTEPARR